MKKPNRAPKPPPNSPPTSSGSQSNKPPVERAIERWILEGQDLAAIREATATLYPDADPDKTLAVVTQNFVRLYRSPVESITGWCMAATRDLYRRLLEVGDFTGALKAAAQLAALAEKAERMKRDTNHIGDIEL